MSDKSPRQGMTKKSGKSIKEKRAEKRDKADRGPRPRASSTARSDPAPPRGRRHLRQGERAPPAAPPRAPRRGSTRTSARRITLEHGYGARFGVPDADLADVVAGFATREEILAGSDVVAAAQAAARRPRPAPRGGRCSGGGRTASRTPPDPARHRPAAHADRLRGDEPLDPGRQRRPPRLPQEQRAAPATARSCRRCSSPAAPATTAVGCARS